MSMSLVIGGTVDMVRVDPRLATTYTCRSPKLLNNGPDMLKLRLPTWHCVSALVTYGAVPSGTGV